LRPAATTIGAPLTKVPRRILPAIVLSQLAGTAPWFACNAVIPDLAEQWGLPVSSVSDLTSAVQGGFIAGTLTFAIFMVADRFPARAVFLICALASAIFNAAVTVIPSMVGEGDPAQTLRVLLLFRFLTGFFIAGIYPVGMKIAAGWYDRGLGAALGFLVGALVLGTAMPHGLRAFAGTTALWSWQSVILSVSVITSMGGAVMYFVVPPSRRLSAVKRVDPRALFVIWRDETVRAPAFGYFGHMWELYTFWLLVPTIVAQRVPAEDVSLTSFLVIGVGFFGCVIGGLFAPRIGSGMVAALQLATSGLCCLLSPFLLGSPLPVFVMWLILWGVTVVGDSPQFSTLVANGSGRESVGSVLTLVNCIGFAITIVSMQAIAWLMEQASLSIALPVLAVGPVLGLLALRPLLSRRTL
jgi:MFS family permease